MTILELLTSCVLPSKSPTLSFDLQALRLSYSNAKWIANTLPYELIASSSDLADAGLDLKWEKEPFELPLPLLSHQEHMINVFVEMKRLRRNMAGKRDDQECPRILHYEASNKRLVVQRAHYSQQVATNLSLDYELKEPLRGELGDSIRKIDATYALLEGKLVKKPVAEGELRPLKESFLANTLGVCCLILCKDKKTLWRARSEKNAIYQNQPHVPVSFAQEIQSGAAALPRTLEELVLQDLPTEFLQETGLEYGTFISKARPIALCRDIYRAGKPQLFLFLDARCDSASFIAAQQKVPCADEYLKKKAVSIDPTDAPDNMSAELAASLYFLRQELAL